MIYVVLAAGRSRRMGFDKVVTPMAGRSPLARLAHALGDRPAVLVVPQRLAALAARAMPGARIALNDDPERGMSHSLRIGLRLLDGNCDFGVLLGDMPLMTEATLVKTAALLAGSIDVAFPVNAAGRPGHPVLFSARARTLVETLPDGDTLHRVRDDPSLRRATWCCTDGSAFFDVDDPEQWDNFPNA